MSDRWRRGCFTVILACCNALSLAGVLAAIGVRTNRLRVTLPAELLDLGPIWAGDFCRDDVAHHRHPPGWCPREYTVYIILRFGARGSIHPVLHLPDTAPLVPRTENSHPTTAAPTRGPAR